MDKHSVVTLSCIHAEISGMLIPIISTCSSTCNRRAALAVLYASSIDVVVCCMDL